MKAKAKTRVARRSKSDPLAATAYSFERHIRDMARLND